MYNLESWLRKSIPGRLYQSLQFDFSFRDDPDYSSWKVSGQMGSDHNKFKLILNDNCTEISIDLRVIPEYPALVMESTIRGISDDIPSEWLRRITPIRLRWKDIPRLHVRYVEGGSTEHYYPPKAYTDHVITGDFIYPLQLGHGEDGSSSKMHLPVLQSGIDSGGVVVSMEWSGMWHQTIRTLFEGQTHIHEVQIPVNSLILEQGETLEMPPVHIALYEGSLDEGANVFRRYVYEQICPTLGDRPMIAPISYDHWFGIENAIDEPFLLKQAKRARAIGTEYFVIDAGWFSGGFQEGVGNWADVDRRKFPNGLEGLMDQIRGLGMKPGLWFEIERAHKTSLIYAEHPEWFLTVNDEDPYLNDYAHLDLSLVEAQNWAIETISGWIDRLGLRWSRMDYNIKPKPFWEKSDPTGKKMFGYVKGLYRVLDELRHKYPEWLIEGCASGGRRFDLGTIRRAHTYWFSDQTLDPANCRYMQSGANRFYPGHLLNSAVTVPSIGAGDAGFTETDVYSRMLGALSFNGDIASWSSEWSKKVGRLVEWYKERRWILLEDFYALTPPPNAALQPEVVQFVSRDKRRFLIFGFGSSKGQPVRVYPRNVSAAAQYTIVDENGHHIALLTGAELVAEGLQVVFEAKGHWIREFTQIDYTGNGQ